MGSESRSLPLRFVAPPGWPTPPESWVARHQGWIPPEHWRPPVRGAAAVPAAPHDWVFWRRNGAAWREYAGPFVASATRKVLVTGSIVLLGIGLTVAGALTPATGLALGSIAVLVGGVRLVLAVAEFADQRRRAWAQLIADTETTREHADRDAYAAYRATFGSAR